MIANHEKDTKYFIEKQEPPQTMGTTISNESIITKIPVASS